MHKKRLPMVIGICGRSCSGKTSVAKLLSARSGGQVLHIEADNFIRSRAKHSFRGFENWEHKDAINFKRLVEVLRKLKQGKSALLPTSPGNKSKTVRVYPKPIILVDGYLIFTHGHLVGLMDKKVFIDVSDNTIRLRRIKRRYHPSVDSKEYVEKVLIPFSKRYLKEQRQKADLIVSGEKEQSIIVERIKKFIKS
jgi:uridine kinase